MSQDAGKSAASRSPAAGTNATIPSPSFKPSQTSTAAASKAIKAAAADEGNPVFRMLGLPRIKPRLPSRNWLIFLTITGSFTSAVLYDKYQKRRLQRKWCDLVRSKAEEVLPANSMPRKITIYLSAPPGDGLRSAREHFYEYVKPVLVAGAMEWEVVEGRREGDVRYGAAERVRKRRRRSEGLGPNEEDDKEVQWRAIEDLREKAGTVPFSGEGGDLVIGRHTWKEYIRGLHEGWLGPLEKPREEEVMVDTSSVAVPPNTLEQKAADGHAHSTLGDAAVEAATTIAQDSITNSAADESTTTETETTTPEPPKEEEKPKPKNQKPAPYISTSAYETSTLPRSLPSTLDPTTILPFPHILGFLNTPTRVYRFLTRRHLADKIGMQTATLVLASQSRHFDDSVMGQDGHEVREQEEVLIHEEEEWNKTVKKREGDSERVWLDRIAMDDRVAGRMRVFELAREDRERADRLEREGGWW